jgi:hypothetical protein
MRVGNHALVLRCGGGRHCTDDDDDAVKTAEYSAAGADAEDDGSVTDEPVETAASVGRQPQERRCRACLLSCPEATRHNPARAWYAEQEDRREAAVGLATKQRFGRTKPGDPAAKKKGAGDDDAREGRGSTTAQHRRTRRRILPLNATAPFESPRGADECLGAILGFLKARPVVFWRL